jgi:HK97 family phage portal protein
VSIFRAARETRAITDLSSIPSNADLWFGNSTGKHITKETSMRLSAVWACVSLISDQLATTPVDVFRRQGDRRVPVSPEPAVIVDPYPEMTAVEWRSAILLSLLLRGNAYCFAGDYDRLEYPRSLMPLDPDEVLCDRDESGALRYRVAGERVPSGRMFHVRGKLMPGQVVGMSPIAAHAQTIGLGLSAEEFGARWFADGAHPSAVLSTDQQVNQEQAATIKARFLAAVRGNREPVVLGAGMQYSPISVAAEESQFLESQKFTVNQIARIFNVPAEKIGGSAEGSTLNYSNRSDRLIDFQTDALMPWAVRLEQALNRLLPKPQFMRFNFDAQLRVDPLTRHRVHDLQLKSGTTNPDEVRALEDKLPLPDGQGQTFLWPPVSGTTKIGDRDE